ncbi:MAG TPA: O-antigen ligase family protein [Candidatus Omnitrophica bacterium]|nr:O-antigen ligase family protein [Candidatus Omnitrophota bacterium]
MKNLFVFAVAAITVFIPLGFSNFAFESTRVSTAFFELVLPWIFLIWLVKNIKNGFKSVLSLPLLLLVSVAGFYFAGIFLYFKGGFNPICSEKLLLNMFFMALFFVLTDEDLKEKNMHNWLIYPSVAVFIFGILQSAGINPANYGNEFLEKKRIFSTLANPNNLAFYANLVFFISLFYFTRTKKPFYCFISFAALANLALTKSGSGFAGLLFGMLLLPLGFKKNIRVLTFFLQLILLVSLLAYAVYIKTDSFIYRSSLWSDSLRIFKERPLTGWGLGSFSYLYPEFRNPRIFLMLEDHQIEILHPDNHYIYLAVEGGFIYLFIFLFLNGALFFYLLKQRKKTELSVYYLAILGSMLFQNIFSQSFYGLTPYFLYLYVFALAAKSLIHERAASVEIQKIKNVIAAAFIILNLASSVYAVRVFASDLYLKKAVHYSQVKNLDKAEGFYEKAMDLNYFNVMPHYLLANLYLERGSEQDIYKALKLYNNVEYMAGNYLQVYAFKYLLYRRLGDNARADFYFRKLRFSDPYVYYQFRHYIELELEE